MKIVIKCKKCGCSVWEFNESPKHAEDKHCSQCGAEYCAKNREYVAEDE